MMTDNRSFSDVMPPGVMDIAITGTPAPQVLAALNDLAFQARRFAGEAKAPATRKAYRADWETFSSWSGSMGLSVLPASPETVATYITWMASEGLAAATISRALVSISQAHKMAGYSSPTSNAVVRETVKGILRSLGTAQSQKAPVMPEQLRVMVAALPDNLLGVRDRAILLAGFSGGFRRSEIVGLDVGDIEFTSDGAIINLRHSKTDQEGEGRRVGIPFGSSPMTCPVRALRAWLDAAGITTGSVFRAVGRWGHVGATRLDDRAVARLVQKYAGAVGLNPKVFGGHSLRAGLATAAARAGRSERAIMAQTGHRSVQMVRKYIRQGSLFIENAASGLL